MATLLLFFLQGIYYISLFTLIYIIITIITRVNLWLE